MSHNKIETIDDFAFAKLRKLEDLNVGVNQFSEFPSEGLESLHHIKVHNNPSLQEFPDSSRFPRIQTLVLSYAYHCCQFMQETYMSKQAASSSLFPTSTGGGGGDLNLQEAIFYPGEGGFDHQLWAASANMTNIWGDSSGMSAFSFLFSFLFF